MVGSFDFYPLNDFIYWYFLLSFIISRFNQDLIISFSIFNPVGIDERIYLELKILHTCSTKIVRGEKNNESCIQLFNHNVI